MTFCHIKTINLRSRDQTQMSFGFACLKKLGQNYLVAIWLLKMVSQSGPISI